MNCKLDYIVDISRRRMCNIFLRWECVWEREKGGWDITGFLKLPIVQ